ncbi:LysR family transcriptional regulator [Actinoallomurus vinaceus]|uniref:LysR family transcriptional regulator n=1 Tax=Actinoallomurus vinaceus TaxID=1080074 RepID=A0ABP8UL49_9ACTN
MLDVKRLTMLRDLAEHGRVTAVAELHGVTPSAVSQQLRVLETEAGAALIRREGRILRLTAAGTALAAESEHVLAALERAEGAVRTLDAEPSGELEIGCVPSALATVAAPLVAELTARHPRLRPRIVESEPEDSVPRLKQHGLDLAVAYRYHLLGPPPWSGITAVALFDDPLMVAIPEDLRQAVEDGGLGPLRDRAWISAPTSSACHEVLVHACRNADFTPRIDHWYSDLRSALSLVATGLAVTVLPNLLCADPPAGVAVLPLPGRGRTVEALVRAGAEHQPAIAAALTALADLNGGETTRRGHRGGRRQEGETCSFGT